MTEILYHQDERRANRIYIPRYRNLFGDKREYLRGFGYRGSASRQGWSRAVKELGIGATAFGPGRYDPCVPYAAGGPAWAAHG